MTIYHAGRSECAYFAAMRQVLVDLHRVGKNKFNGLYTYNYQLGMSLQKFPHDDLSLNYYVPENQFGLFGKDVHYVRQRSRDKFFHFNSNRFDIWHATTTLSWYRPFNRSTKFIFTIHDLNFLLEEPHEIKKNRRILRNIQQRVDRADHLVIISDFARRQAMEYLDLGQKPFSIIYPGCAMLNEVIEEKAPAIIPEPGFLFTIGLMIPRKNFHVLMPILKATGRQLVIAGLEASGYKQTIIEEAKKYGVEDRIIFAGSISENEKAWYYQNCAAFMFPSFAEGFGLPVVEAMHYGKAVFLSKEASLPEIGGDDAYYFESFEAGQMIADFEKGLQHYEQHRPSERIRDWSARFSFDEAARKMLEIYRSI